MLAWIKSILCRYMTIIEYCHDCGIRQPLVWMAPNELWSEVMDETPVQGDNMPGVCCPRCFNRRAEEKGIVILWQPVIDFRLTTSRTSGDS